VLDGTPDADAAALRTQYGRTTVELGGERFDFEDERFDRIRVDLGEGLDTLALDGEERVRASVGEGRVRLTGGVELDNVDKLRLNGVHDVTVDDLSATDVFQVDVDAARWSARPSTARPATIRSPSAASASRPCWARRSCASRTPRRPRA
jgi:hypothetical protein